MQDRQDQRLPILARQAKEHMLACPSYPQAGKQVIQLFEDSLALGYFTSSGFQLSNIGNAPCLTPSLHGIANNAP